MNTYIGIDVAKETLDLFISKTKKYYCFPNTAKGIKKLLAVIISSQPTLIVVEATGGLQNAIVNALGEQALPVAVVPPKRVRDFARAIGQLAKTDKLDAELLASYGEKCEPPARPVPNEHQQMLKSLSARREQLIRIRTAEMSRMHSAPNAHIQKYIKKTITYLEKQIAEIEDEISTLIKSDPDLQRKENIIKSSKGCGDVTSLTCITQCPELGLLSKKEINLLIGVAPINNDSGKKKGKHAIHGGRKLLRDKLYMATLSAIRHNPVISRFYKRLIARGKLKKVAIVACMRKMLGILNAMIKNNTPWDPNFCA